MLIARFIFVFGLALGLGSASVAAPITWRFEGTVRILEAGESAELADSLGVGVGARASGYITHELYGIYSAGPEVAIFPASVNGFGLAIGDMVGESTWELGCCYVTVTSDSATGRGTISMQALGFGLPSNSLYPGGAPAGLFLIADTPGVIPDVRYPQSPPPLAALRPFSIADWAGGGAGTGLQIGFSGNAEIPWIVVELTRLEVVPEPEIFALLAFAGIAIAFRRRAA